MKIVQVPKPIIPMNDQFKFPVVPISEGQLLDVRPEDLLNDGLYRKCSTYRGGGGYDRFPFIAERFYGKKYSEQFVVQLQRCVLDCPYCYVTRAGVWGKPVLKTAVELVEDFIASGQQVFHLMGGAPAMYLEHWPSIIQELEKRGIGYIFHSDLMLCERRYKQEELEAISRPNCLYAINIKGTDSLEWQKNTRKRLSQSLFWANLHSCYQAGIPAYVTFTGASHSGIEFFWKQVEHQIGYQVRSKFESTSFNIDLIGYEATAHVDDVEWGL